MSMTNITNAALLRPEEVGPLVVQPVTAESVAMQVATVVTTGSASYRIPMITADSTAGWFAEGAEITPSDATTNEIDVVPSKVAGLSIISRELANDSSPLAAQVVGQSLARDIARRIDAAFFANTTSNGPSGLLSISPSIVDTRAATALPSVTATAATDKINSTAHGLSNGDVVVFSALTGGAGLVVDTPYYVVNKSANDFEVSATAGGAKIDVTTDASAASAYKRVLSNLDPFAQAISLAENVGATITSFCLNPADLLTLAVLKDQTGSNRPLLGTDPTAPTKRTALGIPLIPTPAVKVGTIWGVPKDRVMIVVREGATLDVDRSAYFSSDRVGVRAIMRVGFGFPHAAAVTRLY